MNQQWLKSKCVELEIVPPYFHRRNISKRAIRTFKNHLISSLCSTHPNFPLYLWEDLLEQVMITVNLLRASRIHPHLSAFHSFTGAYDYTKTPMAPPGIKVVALTPTQVRETWAPHGKTGYYVGPARNHYRCYKIYIPTTRSIVTTDTIEYCDDNKFEITYPTL